MNQSTEIVCILYEIYWIWHKTKSNASESFNTSTNQNLVKRWIKLHRISNQREKKTFSNIDFSLYNLVLAKNLKEWKKVKFSSKRSAFKSVLISNRKKPSTKLIVIFQSKFMLCMQFAFITSFLTKIHFFFNFIFCGFHVDSRKICLPTDSDQHQLWTLLIVNFSPIFSRTWLYWFVTISHAIEICCKTDDGKIDTHTQKNIVSFYLI